MPDTIRAFQIPLVSGQEPAVETIEDIDSCDLIYADDVHDGDVIDLIEEERCPRSPDGSHTYINRNHCNYCNMEAPWLRRDMCRQM